MYNFIFWLQMIKTPYMYFQSQFSYQRLRFWITIHAGYFNVPFLHRLSQTQTIFLVDKSYFMFQIYFYSRYLCRPPHRILHIKFVLNDDLNLWKTIDWFSSGVEHFSRYIYNIGRYNNIIVQQFTRRAIKARHIYIYQQ